MEFELLRSFVAVADCGGFHRAAERLNLTQSTVSQQIKRLEDALRRPLLLRNGKRVALTEEGERLLRDAKALEAAGAFSVVLEGIPSALGAKITESLHVPTIGIGAGPGCDAQVLVWQDMAGLSPRSPKFAKRYADIGAALREAASEFAAEVAGGTFPTEEYSYR